ncbi:hypothetical protein ATANTOWER_000171 [Ataeniobius toweri]|uniref:Uncharacterized protein n=1 Tax=Ataeniobius toweri TaxID=208326 RepID=A0ABU7AUF1_9TELE|nr:hypothetical protein [Ataeniobius toweri]
MDYLSPLLQRPGHIRLSLRVPPLGHFVSGTFLPLKDLESTASSSSLADCSGKQFSGDQWFRRPKSHHGSVSVSTPHSDYWGGSLLVFCVTSESGIAGV